MLKDWRQHLQCPLSCDLFHSNYIIIYDILSPLCHLDKNPISKDTLPENLTNNDTTKKIQGKKLFSVLVQQKRRAGERRVGV